MLHRLELARTQGEDRRRAAAFERLVLGRGDVDEAELANFGVHPGRLYIGVRARARERPAAFAVERTLLDAARRHGGVVGRIGDDPAGIVAELPRSPAAAAVIGFGPAVAISEAARSVALAGRAAETAVAMGFEGLVSIDDLRLRCPLVSEADIGEGLVRRYLAPLDGLGEFGAAVRSSLVAYLDNGLRVDPTARAQGVHPNTLRNRLARFEQLTGADLRRIDDVVELWWALRRRELAGISNRI
jgi:hypothetical protein